MARDRTPRDAFGRPLDPDADVGTDTDVRIDTDVAIDTGDPRPARRWEEPPSPPAAVDQANPQATIALVLGVLGLVAVPYLVSIAAIVVANRADRVADALPGAPGRSAARMGRILGYVGLGLWVFVPLLFIVALVAGSSGSL
jgi:hypothetical protein